MEIPIFCIGDLIFHIRTPAVCHVIRTWGTRAWTKVDDPIERHTDLLRNGYIKIVSNWSSLDIKYMWLKCIDWPVTDGIFEITGVTKNLVFVHFVLYQTPRVVCDGTQIQIFHLIKRNCCTHMAKSELCWNIPWFVYVFSSTGNINRMHCCFTQVTVIPMFFNIQSIHDSIFQEIASIQLIV